MVTAVKSVKTKICILFFKPLMGLITKPIKDELENFVKNLYVKAKNTDSPIDDLLVKALATVLSIEVE